jgi:hypothetical protein
MLFIMSGALLPLGLLALLASLQSLHTKRLQHRADARLVATSEARQLDVVVYRAANVVRFASGAEIGGGPRCQSLIAEADRLLPPGTRIALFEINGRPRCTSPGFELADTTPPPRAIGAELSLVTSGATSGGLRFAIRSENGAFGIGELSREALVQAVEGEDRAQGMVLRQGDHALVLATATATGPLAHRVAVASQVGGGQLTLVVTSAVNAISAVEILLVLLPLIMWAAAALIGWVVINQLLLRPLGRLQRSVANAAVAGATSGHFIMPRLQTPAREIRTLAEAFATATEQIAQREMRLEEGLRNQVLLTREVHHRVKNNLQVVASLINLHARGTGGEVATAYASIQRRVDALAIVHRNHYAELEKHNGVSLRALVAELTANLRAGAPAGAVNFAITLNRIAGNVSQDVAVPVAFLITELVELLMTRAPREPVRITLETTDLPTRATLTITSLGLSALGAEDADLERFGRIIAGLARQLRSALAFDAAQGRYSIAIPILGDPEE